MNTDLPYKLHKSVHMAMTISSTYIMMCCYMTFCMTFLMMFEKSSRIYAQDQNKSTHAHVISRLRATYWSDPSESIVLGWDQKVLGAKIYYRIRAKKQDYTTLTSQWSHALTIAVPNHSFTHWVQLSGLEAEQSYEFKITNATGESLIYWFQTLSKLEKPLHIVAGGDSRNHRKVRRTTNRLVAFLSPDFVMFSGDFTTQSTDQQWEEWLDDWQLTLNESGKVIPLLPARGNHDSAHSMRQIWGRAFLDFYYAFNIHGHLLRVYTLNSEIPAGGAQGKWLAQDLAAHTQQKLKFIQYHKPMRPHNLYKREGQDEYKNWAPLFTQYNVNLALECDSHLMKITWPLIYDPRGEEGFSKASAKQKGTVFIGEGGWGAPLRQVNDKKSWTQRAERMNHIFSIRIHSNTRYQIQALSIPVMRTFPQTIHQYTHSKPRSKINRRLIADFQKVIQFSPIYHYDFP